MEIVDNENYERLYCNSCRSYTRHQLLSKSICTEVLSDADTGPFAGVDYKWTVFQCLGCESLLLQDVSHPPWESEELVSYYPPRHAQHWEEKFYHRLPKNLKFLYKEIVKAHDNSLLLLCAAGLRSLLEGICENKGITEGPDAEGKMTRNLEGRINGLATVVPPGIVTNLHGFRFLGNQALHRLTVPDKDDLELALRVIEDVLNVVYELDYRAQQLFEKTSKKTDKKQP